MQIAIVDDRIEDRKELSACLEKYMQQNNLKYTLTEFEDAVHFLDAAVQIDFQLVFMDIYMEGMKSAYGCQKTTVHGCAWRTAFMSDRKCSLLMPIC